MYRVTKTFTHELGLSCAFRQWRAESHCRFLHGYALAFAVTFESNELERNGWVIDFGSLKEIKTALGETFDHKVLVAEDDPALSWFMEGQNRGYADVVIMDRVGCESFAAVVFTLVQRWLVETAPRVRVVEVECREHGANAAKVTP